MKGKVGTDKVQHGSPTKIKADQTCSRARKLRRISFFFCYFYCCCCVHRFPFIFFLFKFRFTAKSIWFYCDGSCSLFPLLFSAGKLCWFFFDWKSHFLHSVIIYSFCYRKLWTSHCCRKHTVIWNESSSFFCLNILPWECHSLLFFQVEELFEIKKRTSWTENHLPGFPYSRKFQCSFGSFFVVSSLSTNSGV